MRISTALITALLGTGVLAGCGDDEEPTDAASATTPNAATRQEPAGTESAPAVEDDKTGRDEVAVEDLVADPARYAGDPITVTGDVEGAPDAPAAFDLTAAQGDRAVVVLPTRESGDVSGVVSDERVTVTGVVEPKDDGLVDRYDFLFEDDPGSADVLADVDGDHVLVASSVTDAS